MIQSATQTQRHAGRDQIDQWLNYGSANSMTMMTFSDLVLTADIFRTGLITKQPSWLWNMLLMVHNIVKWCHMILMRSQTGGSQTWPCHWGIRVLLHSSTIALKTTRSVFESLSNYWLRNYANLNERNLECMERQGAILLSQDEGFQRRNHLGVPPLVWVHQSLWLSLRGGRRMALEVRQCYIGLLM